VLLHETYSRLRSIPVTVVTEPRERTPEDAALAGLIEHRIRGTHWGVSNSSALLRHWRTAVLLRRLNSNNRSIVHCARALPEGVAAWMSRRLGGPRYTCWAHGEDLALAKGSRELAMLTNRVYRGASVAIANSRNTASILHDMGIAPHHVRIVYPGVDIRRFSPTVDGTDVRRQYAPNGETLLLSVGRLQRRKGHDTTIRALAGLSKRSRHVRYVIAGNGEERGYLEQLAADLGVRDSVIFAGEISADLLPSLYRACDIFVLPNRVEQGDIEGFGIVFLEAASSGKPAIGGNSGGVPEAIEDGVTGLLVSGPDPAELGQTIERLMNDSNARERMGHDGRQRAQRSFTWDIAAQKILDIHRELGSSRN
jgi:phosphatidylinositol alpha-1,6-mannosyltransferase